MVYEIVMKLKKIKIQYLNCFFIGLSYVRNVYPKFLLIISIMCKNQEY